MYLGLFTDSLNRVNKTKINDFFYLPVLHNSSFPLLDMVGLLCIGKLIIIRSKNSQNKDQENLYLMVGGVMQFASCQEREVSACAMIFPSVCCEYVLLPLVNKEAVSASGLAEYYKVEIANR